MSEETAPANPFAAAIAEKKRLKEKDLARVRELAEQYKGVRNSTELMATKMGVSMKTMRTWRKLAGVPLLRNSGRPDPTATKPVEDKPLFTLGWNILQLFDTLLAYFNVVEEHDDDTNADEDPEAVEAAAPRDPRSTWTAWRVFLAAAFGVPQDELLVDHNQEAKLDPPPVYPGVTGEGVERGAAALPPGASAQEIFERCTGRTTWPTVQAKIASLIVGRRGGKSYITAIIGIYLACCRKYKLNLGTKGMVMILARDRAQAGVIRGYVLAFLKAVPILRDLLLDEPTQSLIELKNGITIEIRAVGEAGTRGYTVVAALADEIAFWPTDVESAKQDKKVLLALRPAMLGIKGAMLVMLSSPYAKRGELYEAHRKAYGKEELTRYLVWQADTLSMRPDDDAELLETIREAYEDDPESAKAEYGAQFRSDLESIYSRAAIEAVAVPGRFEEGYQTKFRYRAFVDPSGGSADSYVLAIGRDEKRTVNGETFTIPVLVKVVEWKAKFDPEAVSLEVVQHCKAFKIHGVVGDAYGGEWPRAPLKKHGISYTLSDKTRSELYLDFLPIVNSARCELLDPYQHKRMVNQFANLERRVGRSGKDSVDHPPGGHDDVANAVAGVMVNAGSSRRVRSTW